MDCIKQTSKISGFVFVEAQIKRNSHHRHCKWVYLCSACMPRCWFFSFWKNSSINEFSGIWTIQYNSELQEGDLELLTFPPLVLRITLIIERCIVLINTLRADTRQQGHDPWCEIIRDVLQHVVSKSSAVQPASCREFGSYFIIAGLITGTLLFWNRD